MANNSRLKYGLVNFLTITGDLMVLNILWVFCSLPIITIGPSTNALFKICFDLVDGQPTKVIRTFFKTFKDNFKQSFVIGIFFIFAAITIYFDIAYVIAMEGIIRRLYIIVTCIALAIVLTIITYLNGLVCKYNNTFKGHIINTFKLAFTHPIRTIIMWVVIASPVLCLRFVPFIVILYLGWFFILFFISLPIFICSIILSGIFKSFDDKGVIENE